jgi:hypothetical protein
MSFRWLLLALIVACPCGLSLMTGLDARQAPSPAGIPRTADGKPDFTGTYQWPTYLPGDERGRSSATVFDRKRFAGDIARFRKGGPPAPVPEAAPPAAPERKRKRKSKNNAKKKNKKKKRADGAPSGELSVPGWLVLGVGVLVSLIPSLGLLSADVVEGFSVFKGAGVKDAADGAVEVEPRKDEDTEAERRRKEAEREIEVMLTIHPFCGWHKKVYLNM